MDINFRASKASCVSSAQPDSSFSPSLAHSEIESSSSLKTKSLEVALKELASKVEPDSSGLSILSALIQHTHESMSHIVENMTLSREELRELEERKTRLEKVERLAKTKELDEIEAKRAIEFLLSEEDKKLLDEQYAMQANKYA